MKPEDAKCNGDHCSPDCIYKEEFSHPFYHHNGWCWYQMKQLFWHDYYLADCLYSNGDVKLIENFGRGLK